MAQNNVNRSRPGQPSLTERLSQQRSSRGNPGVQHDGTHSTASLSSYYRDWPNGTDRLYEEVRRQEDLIWRNEVFGRESLRDRASGAAAQASSGAARANAAAEVYLPTARVVEGSINVGTPALRDNTVVTQNFDQGYGRVSPSGYFTNTQTLHTYSDKHPGSPAAPAAEVDLLSSELKATRELLSAAEARERKARTESLEALKQLEIEKQKPRLGGYSFSKKTSQNAEKGDSQGFAESDLSVNLFLAEINDWGDGLTGEFSFEGGCSMTASDKSLFERLNCVAHSFRENELVSVIQAAEYSDMPGSIQLEQCLVYGNYLLNSCRVVSEMLEGKHIAVSVPKGVFEEEYVAKGVGPVGIVYRIRLEVGEVAHSVRFVKYGHPPYWAQAMHLEPVSLMLAVDQKVRRVSKALIEESSRNLSPSVNALGFLRTLDDIRFHASPAGNYLGCIIPSLPSFAPLRKVCNEFGGRDLVARLREEEHLSNAYPSATVRGPIGITSYDSGINASLSTGRSNLATFIQNTMSNGLSSLVWEDWADEGSS